MVRFLFLIFLFVGEVREVSLRETFVYPSKVIEKEHHFLYVYKEIRKIEGCYVNHPRDRGKETYGGISRRSFPKWYGWQYIDQAKPLQRHDTVDRAEMWVQDFYLDLWVDQGFEVIENQEVALNLFDFVIHSSPRTVELKVNRVLEKLGCDPVKVQGEWVTNEFNRVPPREFVLMLKIERIKLFNYLVTRDPSQKVFYIGWLRRLDTI